MTLAEDVVDLFDEMTWNEVDYEPLVKRHSHGDCRPCNPPTTC